jgi:hypothetical protein
VGKVIIFVGEALYELCRLKQGRCILRRGEDGATHSLDLLPVFWTGLFWKIPVLRQGLWDEEGP